MEAALIGLALLLGASAFFSGSEVALFALNRVQMRRMQKSGDRTEERVAGLLGRPADLLSTILVGNTLVNVATAAVVTTLCLGLLPRHANLAAGLAIALDLFVVLIIGEVLPKTLAIRNPERFARMSSLPLWLMRLIFRPVVLVLSGLAVLLLRLLGLRPTLRPGGSLSDGDLRGLFETMEEGTGILAEERRIARRIFEFSSGRAAEVMTPRVDIQALERSVTRESITEVLRSSRHARLPVYDGNLDEIVGFINAKQYLLHQELPPGELLNRVLFVPENKRVCDIFHEMQRQAIGMAVVVDEYGHTAGIITKEDLVEEIVGEIYDEYEAGQAPIIKLGPGRFLVGGLLNVSDLIEEIPVRLETEAVTVNGMLAELLGRIPRSGEIVEHAGLMFQVGEVRRHRVVRCVVRVVEDPRPGAEDGEGEPHDPTPFEPRTDDQAPDEEAER